MVGFGIFAAGVGIALWRELRQFQSVEAWIDREQVSKGESFGISFECEARKPVKIKAFTASLLFREEVQTSKAKEPNKFSTENFDRVIQTETAAGRVLTNWESRTEEFRLRIPDEAMTIQNPAMGRPKAQVRGLWVVKVDLKLEDGEISREYEVPFEGSVFVA